MLCQKASLVLIVVVCLFAPGFAAGEAESPPDPILINDVRPWDGSSKAETSVNILVEAGHIKAVTAGPVDAEAHTIVVDGGGRVVMGKLDVGAPANLLVIDGNPAEDITILAQPSASFLVVKKGIIQEMESSVTLGESPAEQSKFKVVDPMRFKVKILPHKPWYAYSHDRFSIAFAGGVLLDRTEFYQDSDSKRQLGSQNEFNTGEIRAVRFGVGGYVKLFAIPWGYTFVVANRAFDRGFDTSDDQEWLFYDWAIGVPIYAGAVLKVGKQKENISHDRLSLLVDQQFMERAAVLDTLLPSRNTGVTLSNDALDGRMTWSVGMFFNMLGDRDEPFEESKQYIARLSGLPFISQDKETLVHAGIGYRYSDVDSHVLRFRGGPEAFFSQDFVDTGEFDASRASWLSLEGGWRQGPFWLMSEYLRTYVTSDEADDPVFEGWHLTGAWAITGESRPYNRKKGIFGKLTPARNVMDGGFGAWEAVARYSQVDLADGRIEGGNMTRWSLGLNWYLSSQLKLTGQYGWVDLDRFGISSTTRVLQIRMAFLLGL